MGSKINYGCRGSGKNEVGRVVTGENKIRFSRHGHGRALRSVLGECANHASGLMPANNATNGEYKDKLYYFYCSGAGI
jgi:hypothetical protein